MTTYHKQAHLLRLMAHPMRLEILAIVRGSDECVCHLSAVLKKPQPYVSQQLAVLRKEGIITEHNEGTYVYYGLADTPAAAQAAAILRVIAPEARSAATAGHQRVAGCSCPKCEPGGTCSPRPAAVQASSLAPLQEEAVLP
jgi:DNA-binding transcriptional ArsR family regulator